ncbi:MAG: hypothetical protein ACOVOU_07790, partial [Rubrivivax sp.]
SRAHPMSPPPPPRRRDVVAGCPRRPPPAGRRAWMVANHQLSDAEAAAIESAVAAEIAGAVAFAEAGTLEPVAELERFVLMDRVVQDPAPGARP